MIVDGHCLSSPASGRLSLLEGRSRSSRSSWIKSKAKQQTSKIESRRTGNKLSERY
jgi:hypothetical protein